MAESQAVAKQALEKLEDQLTCAICLDAFKDPNCSNASMSTARTASSDWWSQTDRDNSPYAAPPADNPPSFPQLLVCLASSQHSISTTSWRFKKLSRKSKSQKRSNVRNVRNRELLQNFVEIAENLSVKSALRCTANGMSLPTMRWSAWSRYGAT